MKLVNGTINIIAIIGVVILFSLFIGSPAMADQVNIPAPDLVDAGITWLDWLLGS